jgi:hypothetical protein
MGGVTFLHSTFFRPSGEDLRLKHGVLRTARAKSPIKDA